jgi:PKD repeat protein
MKSLLCFAAILLTILPLNAQNCIDSSLICTTCPCPDLWAPVCGCNDVTYGNDCEAGNAGVVAWTPGECTTGGSDCPDAIAGTIVQGVECNLIDIGTGTLLMPCLAPDEYWALPLGAVFEFMYVESGCSSFCMQGQAIDITCMALEPTEETCQAGFSFAYQNYQYNFYDQATGNSLINWSWTLDGNVISTQSTANHLFSATGWHEVCQTVTSAGGCTSTICDSIYVNDGCIDSSLICPPVSLCCDAPLELPVCGCNGITYQNSCIAYLFSGVMSYTEGACVSSSKDKLPINIAVSPNPASHLIQVTLSYNRGGYTLRCYNAVGQPMTTIERIDGLSIQLDIIDWASGYYLIEVIWSEGRKTMGFVKM